MRRLGRIIAALSPEVSHEQETERLMLSLKFQILYALVWLRLSTGNLPLQQLESLTGLVGRLATRMDQAMAKVSALSAQAVLPEDSALKDQVISDSPNSVLPGSCLTQKIRSFADNSGNRKP